MWVGLQVPYYATSSEQLARNVQSLLVRLGIVTGVITKTFNYRYQGETHQRAGFTVHLMGETIRARKPKITSYRM